MQEASGVRLQQCDRRQSCHGVCQQVKLTGISQASKSFQGLRSEGEIRTAAGVYMKTFPQVMPLLFRGFGQLVGLWGFKRRVCDQEITGLCPGWWNRENIFTAFTFTIKRP